MSRASLVRAIAAFAVIATSLYIALTMSPRLGLDLRGGTQLVLETQDSPTVKADAAATDRTLEVLRRRADSLGVADAPLARSGERRIIVELPGVQDPTKAAEVIGKTAQLTFHPVLGAPDPGAKTKPGKESRSCPTIAAPRCTSDRPPSPATASAVPRPGSTPSRAVAGSSPSTSAIRDVRRGPS